MSNTNNTDVITHSDPERNETRRSSTRPQQSDDSTIIRRTLVERGIRPVRDDNVPNGQSSTLTAMTTIVKQHKEEQRDLQELNAKFSIYLDRVQYLENHNQYLTSEITNLKQTWGGDATHLHATYDPQLQTLRGEINNAIRDQGLQELQLKRQEYELWQVQQQLAIFDDNSDLNRLNFLKQELEASNNELDHLRNHLDQRSTDLIRQRSIMDELLRDLENVKNELDNHQLERIVIENELQTLREHTGFHNAVYKAQRDELVSLGKI